MKLLGIDIGGSGIKGAVVDTRTGVLVTDRLRLETPKPATPDAVGDTVRRIARHLDWKGPTGVTFPGVVVDGIIHTAANLDPAWVGVDAARRFRKATKGAVSVLNDADAAGVAEQAFGAAADHPGTVVVVTLGTGIGTAMVRNGHLVPNLELGHLPLHGASAERYASDAARERGGLSYSGWAVRLSEYFGALEALVWPDLFVIGGGVSKDPGPWLPLIDCRTPIVPARLRNKAGIVGAALRAHHDASTARRRRR
jgi:polyphosphate glucokinase